MTTRTEHIEWCKRRALEELNGGSVDAAYASMLSDLGKHDETREHPARTLMAFMYAGGQLKTPEQIRDFIEGFN